MKKTNKASQVKQFMHQTIQWALNMNISEEENSDLRELEAHLLRFELEENKDRKFST